MTTTPNRQFCFDVMTTALECGIGYWAAARKVSRNDDFDVTGFEVKPAESSFESDDPRDHWQLIEGKNIRKACEKIIRGEIQVSDYIRNDVRRGYLEADASYLDAESADVIVQVAAFGEIVFG